MAKETMNVKTKRPVRSEGQSRNSNRTSGQTVQGSSKADTTSPKAKPGRVPTGTGVEGPRAAEYVPSAEGFWGPSESNYIAIKSHDWMLALVLALIIGAFLLTIFLLTGRHA